MKKIYVVVLAVLLALVVSVCGDNSIDTRVDPAAKSTGMFPIKITGDRVTSGAQIYAENCASCHGPVNGSVTLAAAPVHGEAGHTWHHPDRLLFQWILDRPPLATVMPAFRGTLTGEQVIEALAYIKSQWPQDIQDRQNQRSAQYEAQVVEFGTE
jgi:mono/diheme cytochrome c family protein